MVDSSELLTPESLMQMAVATARQGIAAGQSPFGCAIALEGRLIAATHNTVLASTDITAHAEINALRAACLSAGRISLAGALVVSTCEPCPMCMAALHWARVERVYFGATIADATQAGFNELQLSAADVVRIGGSDVELIGGCLAADCRRLFDEWVARPDHRAY